MEERKQFDVSVEEEVNSLLNYSITPYIKDRKLYNMCCDLLTYPWFINGYGSSIDSDHKHHAYPYGLLIHTKEVVDLCVALTLTMQIDSNVLLTAALWHDYGKIYDYDQDGNKTDHYSKVHHISRSYAECMKKFDEYDVDYNIRDHIGHCILSHHGRKEWGSPVEPGTKEAHILHYADMLSSKFGRRR